MVVFEDASLFFPSHLLTDLFFSFFSQVESETDWPDQPLAKTGPQYPHIYKYILYCTTTFMNPSAKTMPLWVRQELVKLAREFDILVSESQQGRIFPKTIAYSRACHCCSWSRTTYMTFYTGLPTIPV